MTHSTAQPTPERFEKDGAALTAQATGSSDAPRRRGGRDLTEGSIPRNLWSLAWPSTVTGALTSVDSLAEIAWAGFMGVHAIAGLGAAQTWVQLFNTGRTGLDSSARALLSRAVGAKDIPMANHIAGQTMLLNGITAAAMMLAGLLLSEVLMTMLGVTAGVVAEGAAYLRWRFVSTSLNSVLSVNTTVLQASGDAITPMQTYLVTRILHIMLAPILIFGWGVPAMGIAGSSCAYAAVHVVGVAITTYMFVAGRTQLRPNLSLRPDLPLFWHLIRVGAPASVSNSERSLAQLVLVGIVAPFGDLALAAYSLMTRIQQFVNLGQHGLAQAAGVLVGQNLGAQKVQRARSTTWWALVYTAVLSITIGALVFFFPQPLIAVFTRDATLSELAATWLQISVVGFLGLGLGNVFMQVLNTAGDTGLPMLVSLGSIWFVQQPLALALSGSSAAFELFGQTFSLPAVMGLGDLGIAWAITIAIMVRLAIFIPYFVWGGWYQRKVY